MPFATSHDNIKLFYRVEGPVGAPAVMFSNSLGTDHMMWQPQAEALADRFQVIRYDQRGHGASDVPGDSYTLEQLGKDALSIADHLGLETFSFCGLSMGGLTGQWLGINAPERLEKLVLADTAAQFPPPEMWEERMSAIRDGGIAPLAEAILERFFTENMREANPARVEAFRRILLEMNPDGYLGCCAALKVADISEAISSIAVPTLVISGEHDPSTPPERGEFIASRIKGAKHVVLDAAHISNIEQPEDFTRALKEFLIGDGLSNDDRFTRGMARRRAVIGDAWVDRANARRTSFNSDFQDLITRYAWGDVWTRPGLDTETRRMLVLVICGALSRWEEFDLHARAALDAGLSPDKLREAFLHLAIYAGAPAANTAFARVGDMLADRDQAG